MLNERTEELNAQLRDFDDNQAKWAAADDADLIRATLVAKRGRAKRFALRQTYLITYMEDCTAAIVAYQQAMARRHVSESDDSE